MVKQAQAQVGWRQMGLRLVRPLDEADVAAAEMFVQPRIEKFIRRIETIEVAVAKV